MVKRKYLRKHLSTNLAACLIGATTISCAATTVAILENAQNTEREIPKSFLNISQDGKTLYGFNQNIRQTDIYDYDVLRIPDGIETIKSYAFMYLFDGSGSLVNKVYFCNSLKVIEAGAFQYCSGIKRINHFILGERDFSQLEYIGYEAFAESGIHGELALPTTLKYIGRRAFEGCEEIENIYFPTTIETIDAYAFNECLRLSIIDLSEFTSIPPWLKKRNHIFTRCGSEATATTKSILFNEINETEEEWRDCITGRQNLPEESGFRYELLNTLPQNKLKTNDKGDELLGFVDDFELEDLKNYALIHIPNGVKTVKANAFKDKIQNCRVRIIMQTVDTIEQSAFEGCSGIIGTIKLPQIEKIGTRAFYKCTNVHAIYFENTMEEIGDEICRYCTNLFSIKLFPDVSLEQKLGDGLCADCPNLHEINLTAYPQIIDEWRRTYNVKPFANIAHNGIIKLDTSIVHLEFWKTLMEDYCGIQNVGEGDSALWTFNNSAINMGCPNIYYDITRDNTVMVGLNDEGKEHKKDFDIILIPSSVQSIYDSAFVDQFHLRHEEEKDIYYFLEFNYGLLEIGKSAFAYNDGISGFLNLPRELQNIDDKAFYGCNHIKGEFIIPDSVLHIGTQAFANCTFLESDNLILPSKLQSIGMSAFHGLDIKKIKISSLPDEISPFAFDGISELTSIDITSWNYNDVLQKMYTSYSLCVAAETGTIQVNNTASQQDWTTLLQSLGLPTGWTISVNGERNV